MRCHFLLSSINKITKQFPILKEARREVLEDLMDIDNAKKIIQDIEEKKIKIEEIYSELPSPFAFNMVILGRADIMKIDEKVEFLRRMHQNILAKVYLKKGKKKEKEFDYHEEWEKNKIESENEEKNFKDRLNQKIAEQNVPGYIKQEIINMIDGYKDIREDAIDYIKKYRKEFKNTWPQELYSFVFKAINP